MWDLRVVVILGAIVTLGAAPLSMGGHPTQQGMHHCDHHRSGVPGYDVDTEMSLDGVVTKVWTEECPGCAGGVHLTLEAGDADYEAHLGPVGYLESKQWELAPGEELTLTGSLVSFRSGGDALIVRELTRGNQTLTLRDEKGIPLWSGGRR